ncbi:hypothetical protein FXO37_17551 [Capsicum annuum]|nr:hypothetical protein FXO37_17551 [Capsicum annuum]
MLKEIRLKVVAFAAGRGRRVDAATTMNGVCRERRSDATTIVDGAGRGKRVAPSTINSNGRGRGTAVVGVSRSRGRGASTNKGREVDGVIGVGRDKGTSFKRPRMVGIGVLQTKNGYKILNLGMSMNSFIVTGHLGHHKPASSVK